MRAYLLIGVLVLIQGCVSDPSIRKDLPGTWVWSNTESTCESGAQKYVISGDGSQVFVSITGSTIALDETTQAERLVYDIIREAPRVMRMKIIGESRKTDDGKVVVWDLVLKSKDSFCWHRTDWPNEACTRVLNKCPG